MKALFFLLVSILFFSCNTTISNENVEEVIPNSYLLHSHKQLEIKNDTLYLNRKKYSGYIYMLHPKGKDTLMLHGYFQGCLHGKQMSRYPNLQIKEIRYYKMGAKDGSQIAYWENGNKKFEFIASNDAYHGILKEWTKEGILYHFGTFEKGHEEGVQKMWYSDGKIRANYIVKNGKRYGLLGTKNCMNVTDSVFNIN